MANNSTKKIKKILVLLICTVLIFTLIPANLVMANAQSNKDVVEQAIAEGDFIRILTLQESLTLAKEKNVYDFSTTYKFFEDNSIEQIFNTGRIENAGGKVTDTGLGQGDPYYCGMRLSVTFGNEVYGHVDGDIYGLNLVYKSEGQSETETIELIKKQVKEIFPTDNSEETWNIDVFKYDSGETAMPDVSDLIPDAYIYYLQKAGYNDCTNEIYVITLQNNTNPSEKSTLFATAVDDKPVRSISVSQKPSKLVYVQDTSDCDTNGGRLNIVYEDGTTEEKDMLPETILNFSTSETGPREILVLYRGKIAKYEINVVLKSIDYISMYILPDQCKYYEKDNLTVMGGMIKVVYNNGDEDYLELTPEMVSGFDNTKIGPQTLTVRYGEYTTTYDIEILQREVQSIFISKKPEKKRYLINVEELDLTGGELKVYFNNGTSEIIEITPDMVSGFDNTVRGENQIKVSYGGETAYFFVDICAENTSHFAGGIGTKEYPYLIKTKSHLDNVRLYPNDHFKLMNDLHFTNRDFGDGGDFYHRGAGWQPICDSFSDAFEGSFDGQGFTISGLQFYKTMLSGNLNTLEGLFGYVGGTIKNLNISDISINVNNTSGGTVYVGGIASYMKSGGEILNSSVSGQMDVCSHMRDVYVVCIAGFAIKNSIANCDFNGNIIASSGNGRYNVGGIIGIMNGGTIKQCNNKGYVKTAEGSKAVLGLNCCGGIVGYASDLIISECYNEGDILSLFYNDLKIDGGIAGYASMSKIDKCYNTGDIESIYAGGITGYASAMNVSNCYNTGEICGRDIGGIVGSFSGSGNLYNCYNIGPIVANDNNSDAGAIVGNLSGESLNNCYYLNVGNANGVGYGDSAGTAALSYDSMKEISSYYGFDFNDVWRVNENSHYPLPHLSYQEVLPVMYIQYCDILEPEDTEFTGEEICPEIMIKNGEKVLTPNIDYTLQYKNNVSVGTAQIIITGIGNYKGTAVKTFEIINNPTGADVIFGDDVVKRIAGSNRYNTAILAADELKAGLGVDKFDNIVVAGGVDYADALSGDYLAKVKNAPMLLVDKYSEEDVKNI